MSMSTPINQIRNQNQNQNQGEQPNMPLMPPVYNPTVDVQLPGQNLNNSSDPSASNASHTQLVEDILNEMEDNPSVEQLDDINTSNFNYATNDVNVPPKKNMNSINNLKAEPTTQFDSNDEQKEEITRLGNIKNLDLLNKDDDIELTPMARMINKVKPIIIVFVVFIILSLHQVNRLLFSFFPKLLHENGQLTLYAIILRATIACLLYFILDILI